jgi:hypothetical protein
MRRREFISLLGGTAVVWPLASRAEKKCGPGADDSAIKVGNIMPYSGPASAFSLARKTIGAYFNKLNADGGINGRKIRFISYDDGMSIACWVPPVTTICSGSQNPGVRSASKRFSQDRGRRPEGCGRFAEILSVLLRPPAMFTTPA